MPDPTSTVTVQRSRRGWRLALVWSVLAVSAVFNGCSESQDRIDRGAQSVVTTGREDSVVTTEGGDSVSDTAAVGDSVTSVEQPADDLLTSLDEQTLELQFALGEWHGDLDGIVAERARLLRLLTVFEPMHYLVDGRRQAGLTVEAARAFEKFLNQRMGKTRAADRIRIILVPVRRDQIIAFLRDGRGDIAAANLTITEERLADVDFSDPLATGAFEVVVTGPSANPVNSLDELSGRPVFVRRSSSYFESLQHLNRDLDDRGLAPASIVEVDEILDDGAILKLVQQGQLPTTIVDAHKADFWVNFFPDLVWNDEVRPREDGQIAWAVQKNAPRLLEEINAFVKTNKKGTLTGNVLINRYMKNTDWLEALEDRLVNQRLDSLKALFQEKAAMYDLDWRRLAAQSFQESGFDQSRRSSRGAIGLMQLMPATAREMGFDDISTADANVEAGAKYMRHVIDTYFSDVENNPGVDRKVAEEEAYATALAAYNAGPTRISRLRRTAESRGVDSRRWFDQMELIVAREVGSEPVKYVQNVMEYSIQLQLTLMLSEERQRVEPNKLEGSDA
jgi:membrane-bound lytic murein transglycosylase MltF